MSVQGVKVRSERVAELGVPEDSFPITPSDTVDLATPIRGIRASGAGNIVVYTRAGGAANPRTIAILAGETRYIKITRVLNTSTTATGLEGML